MMVPMKHQKQVTAEMVTMKPKILHLDQVILMELQKENETQMGLLKGNGT